nr:integrase, catalytic region, zinc finger, CCHC-type, peptidase aspartic, catalytic [Tanacetum cinerariifolium]
MHFPIVTINTKFLNSLQPEWLKYQFKKLVNTSRAKKLEKSHDPLALVAHTGLSSRNTSSYYVTYPTSVVDYDDEYQLDDIQTNSEDLLTSAINSGNAGRNNRRAYVQEEVVEGANETRNVQRTLRNSYSGNTSTIQCYNCSGKGYYARNCLKPRVRDSKYFMKQMLLVKQDEAEVILTDEQNNFLFADASRMEEIEDLSANTCLMARIQPTNQSSDVGPSYNSDFVSEVQSSSINENEEQIDNVDKLDDASKSQQKMKGKMNDPIAVANKQNYWIVDYQQINALYKDFVPQKELSDEQKYFPSSFIPSAKNSKETAYIPASMPSLRHNLFSVGQFCVGDLEVTFRSKTCYVQNLEGDDFLTGGRKSNLYTISISDMAASLPVCLMSKATLTKSWLWHRRLSHLNFDTINDLTRLDLVDGLLKFKYEMDHLCSACEKGKSKKASHSPKLVSNETLEIIKKFIAQAQLNYKAKVCKIRTENGTEFKNATLKAYYEKLGIMQQLLTARTPQQNGVVKRRNRTLVEAAQTMLIFSLLPEFLWVEAVATAFTQNRSIIYTQYNKTPYCFTQKQNLEYFHVFGSLCYPINDRDDLGKMKPKADIGMFIVMSDASSVVTYTSVYTDSKPWRYYKEDLHPPSPIETPYVPESKLPEYLEPSDDEELLEDHPLPADASPIPASPDYMAYFDPEEDLEEDPEDDQTDYPADGGDGDDEPFDDDDDDDTNDEDPEEEPFEDEEDDEEEEEHLALADSSVVPIIDPVLLAGDTEALEADEPTHTPGSPIIIPLSQTRLRRTRKTVRPEPPMSASMEACIARHAGLPSPPLLVPYLPLPLPSPLTTSPTDTGAPLGYRATRIRMRTLLTSTSRRTDIPEADMPPRKRACLTTPALGFDIEESSTTGAARLPGPTKSDLRRYRVEQTEGVNERVTELDTTIRQQTDEFEIRLEEAQDDRTLLRARVNTLFRDRPDHHRTTMLMDREAMYAAVPNTPLNFKNL